ncbi:MAG TPA: hypothetical protein VKU39_20645 [Streptosporangiaceae bacterium]|nr:hypothetical protein [Streptosporangiaceae bacterium]
MTGRPEEDAAAELALLAAAWDEARQRWHDAATVRFDENHWTPLYQTSREFLEALRALRDLIEASSDGCDNQPDIGGWLPQPSDDDRARRRSPQ